MSEALTLELGAAGPWQVRRDSDRVMVALADRHYSRKTRGSSRTAGPGRRLALVTPCERAIWLTQWTDYPPDGIYAWRCSIFRNEGAGRSSDLIRAAMDLTADLWTTRPPDGWLTWVDRRKVASTNPGYCFLKAGWWVDRTYQHPHLRRLRASA